MEWTVPEPVWANGAVIEHRFEVRALPLPVVVPHTLVMQIDGERAIIEAARVRREREALDNVGKTIHEQMSKYGRQG